MVLTLPAEIMTLIAAFAPVFSERVWDWAQVLIVGAVLAPKKRTVSAVLRVMGLSQEQQYQNYHRVLNRAVWSSQSMSQILLGLLVTAFVPGGSPVVMAADETLERRRGAKIKLLGFFRDGVRSSQRHKVITPGLRWVSLMLLAHVPWSSRVWALPFMTVPAPSPEASQALGKRHKTSIYLIRQMTDQVRRWLPGRDLVLVVDGGLAALKSARRCAGYGHPVTYIARLQLNARLFDPPQTPLPGKRGRKPTLGPRQPKPSQWLANPDTPWQRLKVPWYGARQRMMDVLTGTALWHYYDGGWPVPVRWVLVRDPLGKHAPQIFACTNITLTPLVILAYAVMRWSVEVTFQESRAHLGFETQRQWNDLAIARTTPLILGLFSFVTLLAHRLSTSCSLSVRSAAWYPKPQATFSDLIALVRHYLWTHVKFLKATSHPDFLLIPQAAFRDLLETACFST